MSFTVILLTLLNLAIAGISANLAFRCACDLAFCEPNRRLLNAILVIANLFLFVACIGDVFAPIR